MKSNSKIILGTAQFGMDYGINNSKGRISFKEIKKIFDYAKKEGINSLDTAPSYGSSEIIIGKNLGESSNFKINTKISSQTTPILSQVKTSIHNLSVQKIDTILFQSYETFEFFLESMLEFKEINKGTLFNQLGVSVYENYELEKILNYKDLIDTVQFPFNLLDNFSKRGSLIIKLKESNFNIQVRSVFLQGLLLMNKYEILNKFKDLYEPICSLNDIALENSLTLKELCLKYVFSFDLIDNVLIGVDSLNQLIDNQKIDKLPLDDSILMRINEIVVDSNLINPSKWKK